MDSSGVQIDTNVGSIATVNLDDSIIQGGTGTGAGINFANGAGTTNIVNINGNVTLSSLGGTAINDGDGDTSINNNGTLKPSPMAPSILVVAPTP